MQDEKGQSHAKEELQKENLSLIQQYQRLQESQHGKEMRLQNEIIELKKIVYSTRQQIEDRNNFIKLHQDRFERLQNRLQLKDYDEITETCLELYESKQQDKDAQAIESLKNILFQSRDTEQRRRISSHQMVEEMKLWKGII